MIAPGSAHYIRGDYATSDALYKYGGYSFLTFLASGLVLGLSGAADQTVIPFIPLAMGGAAAWLAFASVDLIGSTLDKTKPDSQRNRWENSNKVGLDYIKVESPVFSATSYSGIAYKYRSNGHFFGLRSLISNIGNIERYSLEYGKIVKGRDQQNQGLSLNFKTIHEINPLGFFNMTTLEPSLGLRTDASLFSPGLERIFMKAKFGLQQHIVKYTHGGGGNETDSSMIGFFETGWSAYNWLRTSFGYRHERESLVATETTGFIGVFYAASEFQLQNKYFLKIRSYLTNRFSWDLSLSTTL